MSSHISVINITRVRGDNYPLRFVLSQNGSPLDITGYTFLFTVDPSDAPTDALNNLFQLTGVIADAVNGIVDFNPTEANMDQTPNTYFYDAELVDAATKKRTFARGEFVIEQDITK